MALIAEQTISEIERACGGSSSPPSSGQRRAVLAICSDLDETPDAETYFEIIRFLNTTEDTSMGPGVGLEVGNTIYFDMPPGQFSYWNTTEKNREKIRQLIKSGQIDCIHSFGDLATTRAHAATALEELHKHGCHMKVWVDHSVAPTNFGSDIMRGHGDEPGHPAYHADLTLQYGIQYIWRGRVTSVIGQDRGINLLKLRTVFHPNARLRTFIKEVTKQVAARCGNQKYHLHGPNQTLASCRLRDGREAKEFLRCNPHPEGVSVGDRGDRIQEVLTADFLDRLVERRGVSVVYTHLGKLSGNGRLPDAAVRAFRLLASYVGQGKIAVQRTSRLLRLVAQ